MPKRTVKGGMVRRTGQPEKLAAVVETIDLSWEGANAPRVPAGATGVMVLKAPPPQIGHYDKNDRLYYEDGNHNNDSTLLVTSEVGPSKYKVTVQ